MIARAFAHFGPPRVARRSALLGMLSLACGRQPARASTPPQAPAPRYSGTLEDYVPAAGLRWLLRGSPAKLAESQSFRPAIDVFIKPERLRAVVQTTGLPLASIPRGVIAGFDLGTLYLVELPSPTAATARERFAARQIRGADERRPEPGIVVLTGINEGTPISLVTLDDRVLAYAVGDPMLCRVVEAYARGKLKAKSAFHGAALAGLEQESQDALIAAHVPGPLEERWQNAAGGLCAITTALTAKLVPIAPERARLEVTLHGDFADSDATERLRATYMSVASSSTGTLLGLSDALDARTEISAQGDRVTLMVPLPLTQIAKASHAATNGDLLEILRLPAPNAAPTAPTSSPDSR